MARKLSICVYSGTVDKLLPVAIMTSGAVAMDMEVNLFVTFYGLYAFRKDQVSKNMKFSKDFEEMAPMLMKNMGEMKVPSWYDMLKEAKASGKVRIMACSTAAGVMKVEKKDLVDIVDEVVGVGTYLDQAAGSDITLWI
ncbi:MAG TPA: DsrE/DsrF/DrsH-like family protein [Thermoplasmata archaeon]|nr:DsrE/DsrF/DrsH-like family protein [Thermoplasmata archaeon]